MKETKHLIGTLCNSEGIVSGFRIFGYPSFSVNDVSIGKAIKIAQSEGIYGLTVEDNGIKGNLDNYKKYGVVVKNDLEESSMTIISEIGTEGYCVVATNGVHRNYRTADIIRLANQIKISNGTIQNGRIQSEYNEGFRKI